MGEYADYCIEQEIEHRQEKAERRENATRDFAQIRDKAAGHGVALIRHSESHYRIARGKFSVNVYPGHQRIYCNRRSDCPFLELPLDWSLEDVVKAFVEATKEMR